MEALLSLRAIKEYKKFIYLGAAGDFIVTPSKIIDQVWHELSFLSANLYHTTNQILHCVQDDSQCFIIAVGTLFEICFTIIWFT